jgi:hypothetical protein
MEGSKHRKEKRGENGAHLLKAPPPNISQWQSDFSRVSQEEKHIQATTPRKAVLLLEKLLTRGPQDGLPALPSKRSPMLSPILLHSPLKSKKAVAECPRLSFFLSKDSLLLDGEEFIRILHRIPLTLC